MLTTLHMEGGARLWEVVLLELVGVLRRTEVEPEAWLSCFLIFCLSFLALLAAVFMVSCPCCRIDRSGRNDSVLTVMRIWQAHHKQASHMADIPGFE